MNGRRTAASRGPSASSPWVRPPINALARSSSSSATRSGTALRAAAWNRFATRDWIATNTSSGTSGGFAMTIVPIASAWPSSQMMRSRRRSSRSATTPTRGLSNVGVKSPTSSRSEGVPAAYFLSDVEDERHQTHRVAQEGHNPRKPEHPEPSVVAEQPPRGAACHATPGVLALVVAHAAGSTRPRWPASVSSAGDESPIRGGGVIRTREGRFRPLTAFEAVPFVHSGTPPPVSLARPHPLPAGPGPSSRRS